MIDGHRAVRRRPSSGSARRRRRSSTRSTGCSSSTAGAALEDAGCDPTRFDGSIGVFGGCALQHLPAEQPAAQRHRRGRWASSRVGLGQRQGLADHPRRPHAGPVRPGVRRAELLLDLAGRGLRRGHQPGRTSSATWRWPAASRSACRTHVGYLYQQGGIAPPDGECRAFDAAGLGAPLGSGVGVVALRRLEDALADGDQVYAVIRGWAVNNDGGPQGRLHRARRAGPGRGDRRGAGERRPDARRHRLHRGARHRHRARRRRRAGRAAAGLSRASRC